MALESVNNIQSGDGLALGMFGVSHSISDHVLKEESDDLSGLVVDKAADPLDTSSSGQASDGWLGDSKDDIPGLVALLVTSGSSLACDLLSSFSFVSWCHCAFSVWLIN